MPCDQSQLFLQPTFGCGARLGPNVHSSVIGRIARLRVMADTDWMQTHKLKAKSYFWQRYWLSVENAIHHGIIQLTG